MAANSVPKWVQKRTRAERHFWRTTEHGKPSLIAKAMIWAGLGLLLIAAIALPLLLSGCAAGKPVKAKVPIAPGTVNVKVQLPPGYTAVQDDGYCIPDGLNAGTGRYDFIYCTHKDGSRDTYKRESR